jgi:hypothetical protein
MRMKIVVPAKVVNRIRKLFTKMEGTYKGCLPHQTKNFNRIGPGTTTETYKKTYFAGC